MYLYVPVHLVPDKRIVVSLAQSSNQIQSILAKLLITGVINSIEKLTLCPLDIFGAAKSTCSLRTRSNEQGNCGNWEPRNFC